MQTLDRDIKNRTFKSVCLLFGKEAFSKKSHKSRLREALTGGDVMNYNYSEGRGMNVNEIIGLADIIPFFAERHLVLIEDSEFFKDGAEAGELTKYMGGIPESTCLIFVESGVDKRSRLYKAVEKYGYVAKLSHQEPAQLARWAAGALSRNDRKVTGRTMELFLNKAGDDMENISSELEKPISYTLGREVITDEDVGTICTTQVTSKIFDVITAIAARQTRKAMDLYKGPLMLKELSMHILFLIARQFNQILQVRNLMRKGMDKSTTASGLKLQPFVVGKVILRARAFTREQAPSYVDPCASVEEGVKTGKLQGRLAVELLIVNKYEQR